MRDVAAQLDLSLWRGVDVGPGQRTPSVAGHSAIQRLQFWERVKERFAAQFVQVAVVLVPVMQQVAVIAAAHVGNDAVPIIYDFDVAAMIS